jgi:hypothetical protein
MAGVVGRSDPAVAPNDPPGTRPSLTRLVVVEAAQVAHGSSDYLRLARRAKWLSWASLGYMALEGVIAIMAGIVAGSIALIGFGLDSAIEGFASVVIVWRFTGSRTLSRKAENAPKSWWPSSSSSSRPTSASRQFGRW